MNEAANVGAVSVIPRWEMPPEPSWERARELVANIRRSVEDIILLGLELQALQAQWFSAGGRPAGGNSTHPASSFEKGRQIEFHEVRGWQRRVQEELGISHDTARRIIDRARYVSMLRDVAVGEDVEYTNSLMKVVTLTPTDEMKTLAACALEEVVAGARSPQRAWAGVVGEGQRRADGGVKERGETDHAKHVAAVAVRLRNAFAEWPRLRWQSREQAEKAEAAIAGMLVVLPETFRHSMMSTIIESWSEHERAALAKAIERARRR